MSSKKKVEIAVLVNSCDKYSDLWEYYFFFVNTYWKDCPYRFYMNTEKLKCAFNTSAGNVVTFNSDNKKWSGRLISALKKIKENYVIMMCEDSFFYDKVKQNVLNDCKKMLENDSDIGCITFDQFVPNTFDLGKSGEQFRTRSKKEQYLASAHCSLWKKSYLLKILRRSESPWEFEIFGTIRASHYKDKQYVVMPDAPLVFPFSVKGNSGCGVSGGKWTKGNVSLFEKHGIKCDFSKRGFIDWDEVFNDWNKPQKKLSLIEKIVMPFTDRKRFKERIRPKIKTFLSRVDITGRIKNIFD